LTEPFTKKIKLTPFFGPPCKSSIQAVYTLCTMFPLLVPCSRFCLQCFDAVGWAAGRASGR